jgi:hypothetical protein
MKATLHLEGLSALVMHNERLADPLDSFTKAIAALSKQRNKPEAVHEEIAHLEFLGGLYTNPPTDYPINGSKPVPCLPAWNVLRCLQDGGRRHKRGMDVPRGVYPLAEYAELVYDGPTDPEKMWQAGGFALRKSVGVQRARTMRTRPMFTDWTATLEVEVDAKIWNLSDLRNVWSDAGTYAGLGEMRPIYGRFAATIAEG